MLNLEEMDGKFVWPEHLKPTGYGEFQVESFETWLGKHQEELEHMP